MRCDFRLPTAVPVSILPSPFGFQSLRQTVALSFAQSGRELVEIANVEPVRLFSEELDKILFVNLRKQF